MNKYYKYSSKYIYKGEGGLSYFGIYFEDEYNHNNYLYDNKDSNNGNCCFMISRKKHCYLRYIIIMLVKSFKINRINKNFWSL